MSYPPGVRVLPSLVCLPLLAACSPQPSWSALGPGRKGEQTLVGAPLAIPRARTAPTIDGKLNDTAWATAAVLGPLVDPGSGADDKRSPVAAIARMTWDDRALYVGIVVHDDAPVSTFGRDDVDPHIWGASSGIELMTQPGDPGDNRDYYELQVDVHGAVFDSHFDDYNQPITGTGAGKVFGHQDWSSHVERAVYIAPKFYAVELALPWSSFHGARVAVPPKAGDTWRIDLYSFNDGQRHALAWSPLKGRGNFHKSSQFGRIQFAE